MAGSVSRALYDEVGRVAVGMGYCVGTDGSPRSSVSGRRLALEALLKRLADLEAQSGDAQIGLRVGRMLGPVAVGIPGYLAMAGPTLIEALPRVIGYQRLVTEGVTMRFGASAETVRFDIEHSDVAPSRLLSDLLVSGTRFFGVWLLGHQPPLAEVWFHYPRPASTDFHEEIFGVVPRFDAADDGFALARSWFDEPLRTAEASLVPALEAQALRQLATIREDRFLAAVTEAIVDLITVGESVGMAEVASRLHTSSRTLQRRLQEQGTTFNRLLQEVRMDLANRYLADERLSLIEIAGLLGYQEQSSFCHAYRQWTGRAPSEARRARAGARD